MAKQIKLEIPRTIDELKKSTQEVLDRPDVSMVDKITYLLEACEIVYPDGSGKSAIEAHKTHRKYSQIQEEYLKLKKKMKSQQAIEVLSEKYNYSRKHIERIVWSE
jgi:hypothetical protein